MPVPVFPDFDKPLLLKMDASKEGLGVMDITIQLHLEAAP